MIDVVARVKRCFKLLFPDGRNLWDDKTNGSDMEKTIDGFALQFAREYQKCYDLQHALIPSKTKFLDELDFEFFSVDGGLTEDERRTRLDMRWRMMFQSKNRLALMNEVLQKSGYPDVVVRTLGSNGTNESPYDFFNAAGFAYWGNEDLNWGQEEFIYNNTEVIGGALLVTNGGSIDWWYDGHEAIVQLEQDSDYWGAYFIVEGAGGAVLSIPEDKKNNFFDLLYLVKPADMHGIVRAEFT